MFIKLLINWCVGAEIMGKTSTKLNRVLGTIIGLVIAGFFVFHATPSMAVRSYILTGGHPVFALTSPVVREKPEQSGLLRSAKLFSVDIAQTRMYQAENHPPNDPWHYAYYTVTGWGLYFAERYEPWT